MTAFIETLKRLLDEKGITKNKMLTDLQLGKNSFINWETRGTIPNGATLAKIADYFGVTVDFLLGSAPSAPSSPSSSSAAPSAPSLAYVISPQEQALLLAYRANPSMRPAVDRLLGIEQGGDIASDISSAVNSFSQIIGQK